VAGTLGLKKGSAWVEDRNGPQGATTFENQMAPMATAIRSRSFFLSGRNDLQLIVYLDHTLYASDFLLYHRFLFTV